MVLKVLIAYILNTQRKREREVNESKRKGQFTVDMIPFVMSRKGRVRIEH